MRARDLSNIMWNDFKDSALIEPVWVLGVAYFPQGQITMAKKSTFFLYFLFFVLLAWILHSAFILFLIGSLGGY